MKHHEVAREQFKFDILRWSITSLLMIALIITNAKGHGDIYMDLGFFGAVVGFELFLWILSRTMYRHLFQIPVNLDTLQSRWGVWVMIVVSNLDAYLIFHSVTVLCGMVYRLASLLSNCCIHSILSSTLWTP
jgi:hypothetical protein